MREKASERGREGGKHGYGNSIKNSEGGKHGYGGFSNKNPEVIGY
jgi:hypothetical protein